MKYYYKGYLIDAPNVYLGGNVIVYEPTTKQKDEPVCDKCKCEEKNVQDYLIGDDPTFLKCAINYYVRVSNIERIYVDKTEMSVYNVYVRCKDSGGLLLERFNTEKEAVAFIEELIQELPEC